MSDCIFCKIINREIPADIVYEDEHTLAFLDAKPLNAGHTLVIPKKHFKNYFETPDELLCKLSKVAKKVGEAIRSALSPDGINIGVNTDSAAGQVVFHTHIHVIPRTENDGYKHWNRGKPLDEEPSVTADKIRSKI